MFIRIVTAGAKRRLKLQVEGLCRINHSCNVTSLPWRTRMPSRWISTFSIAAVLALMLAAVIGASMNPR
jgi:hypothetical protein